MDVLKQVKALSRGCEEIYSTTELQQLLDHSASSGRPLRVKLGMDPTAPDIHLGHSVVLRKMREFQNLGHTAVLIIGDYTAMVGDPTGQNSTRPMLQPRDIERNARTYLEQAGRILDTAPGKLEIRKNSEWLGQMTFGDVLRLASRKTVARMLERDTFETRYKAGIEIGIHEFLYPLMQGWDSVCVRADIELGGTDQTFNNLMGRDLQKSENQRPQVVVIMPLLVGLDGTQKMSKSLGNYVAITDTPESMFAKLMSIPDALMTNYFTVLTDLAPGEFEGLIQRNPRDAKVALARYIVTCYADAAAAEKAERTFFDAMKGGVPDDIPKGTISRTELTEGQVAAFRLAILCGFASSNSDARRLVREGGMRLNQQIIEDPSRLLTIRSGDVVQRGKRRFLRLEVAEEAAP